MKTALLIVWPWERWRWGHCFITFTSALLRAGRYRMCATSSSLRCTLPYQVVAPLFGPEGERGWAGGRWDPQFLYPQPAQDTQGAVFTIRHGHHHAVWINTAFDTSARHYQYVYFIPEAMVVLIDVRFSELDAENTKVNVAYERTALNPEANEHVKEMGRADRDSGKEWGTAINEYLAKQKAAGQ